MFLLAHLYIIQKIPYQYYARLSFLRMSKLEELLKEKYNIPEAESKESAQYLVDLFKIFFKEDSRQKQTSSIQEQSNINVKDYDNKRSSN